jgi:hypothetical protein
VVSTRVQQGTLINFFFFFFFFVALWGVTFSPEKISLNK